MAFKDTSESVHVPRHAAEAKNPDASAPRHAAQSKSTEKTAPRHTADHSGSEKTASRRAERPRKAEHSRDSHQSRSRSDSAAKSPSKKKKRVSDRQLQKAARRIWSVSPWTVIMLTFLAVVVAAMLFPKVEDTHVDRNQAPNSYLVLSWDQTGRYGTPGRGKDAPIEFRVPYGVYNVLNNNSIPVVLTISTDGYVAPAETGGATAVTLSATKTAPSGSPSADEDSEEPSAADGTADGASAPADGGSAETATADPLPAEAAGADVGTDAPEMASDASAADIDEASGSGQAGEGTSDAEAEEDEASESESEEEAKSSVASLFEEEEDPGKPVSVTMRPNSSRQIIIDENQYLTLSEDAKELILFYVSEVPEEIESDTTGQYADSQAVVYAYVKGTEVRFRSQPSLDGHIIEVLNNGQQVQVLGVTGEWTHVQIQDHKGYIYSEFLSRQEQDAPGIH